MPKLVPIEPELEEPEPETRPVFTPREIIRLNRKHAVIANLGGKCVIMEFVPSNVTPGTEEPSYQTFKSFRERYLNQYVRDEISDKKISIGQFWLAHPRRRQYEGLDLVPDGPSVLPGNIFNLWRRWGVEAKKVIGHCSASTFTKSSPTVIGSSMITLSVGVHGHSNTQANALAQP